MSTEWIVSKPIYIWQKQFLFYKPEPILKWIDEQECTAFHQAVEDFYTQAAIPSSTTTYDTSDDQGSGSSDEDNDDDDDSVDDFVPPEPHFVHLSLEQ